MQIQENDNLLLQLPSGMMRIIEVRQGIINLGKFGTFSSLDLIGHTIGQSFEIQAEGTLLPIESLTSNLSTEHYLTESSADNRGLSLNGNVQKMSLEEIESMKRQSGGNEIAKEIINKMVSNHESFDKKTVYSQEKYLTRKHKKFLRRFTVNKVTPESLVDFLYQEKEPIKILGLSVESLGLMMSMANVMPGGDYLVVDETGGLIVFAMLERMGGKGTITLIHENDQPTLHLLRHTSWNEKSDLLDEILLSVNVAQFLHPGTERPEFSELTEAEITKLPEVKQTQYKRKLKRHLLSLKAIDHVLESSFDSLVYVSTLNPSSFVPEIIPRLAGSSPIVVYSQYKEVLVNLNHILLQDKRILLPNIHQTVVRKYQTEVGKIHPLMTSRGPGGYLLNGIRVFPMDHVEAGGRYNKKRKAESETPVPTMISIDETQS
ncbi:tRNA 1-methyladenosine methyltransferase subunit [Martiniozyma asiatica (nom. inval.)]|nr:tRNA 1-methyladenosine methyltransferase subunit [Martiniozyma asiatica]